MESYIERLEILRERAELYAERIKDLWNSVPEWDKPLLLFSMENTSCAARKAWPEIGTKVEFLGKIFSSEIITERVPRKENET